MATQPMLLEMPETVPPPSHPAPKRLPRLREPERRQLVMSMIDLEALIPADHLARGIWKIVEQLPTEAFLTENKSVEGHAGRPRTSPHCDGYRAIRT